MVRIDVLMASEASEREHEWRRDEAGATQPRKSVMAWDRRFVLRAWRADTRNANRARLSTRQTCDRLLFAAALASHATCASNQYSSQNLAIHSGSPFL